MTFIVFGTVDCLTLSVLSITKKNVKNEEGRETDCPEDWQSILQHSEYVFLKLQQPY